MRSANIYHGGSPNQKSWPSGSGGTPYTDNDYVVIHKFGSSTEWFTQPLNTLDTEVYTQFSSLPWGMRLYRWQDGDLGNLCSAFSLPSLYDASRNIKCGLYFLQENGGSVDTHTFEFGLRAYNDAVDVDSGVTIPANNNPSFTTILNQDDTTYRWTTNNLVIAGTLAANNFVMMRLARTDTHSGFVTFTHCRLEIPVLSS